MERKILVLLLFFLCHRTNGASEVILPGGGVVGLGKDVVFKYQTDEDWFMCNYYRYEPLQNRENQDVDTEFCSYINQNGVVSQLKCDPESLGDHLQYTGIDSKECTVTVKNITMADDVSWAVRLASDLEPVKFDITVAVALENIYIEAPNTLVAGQPSNITCIVVGGSPKAEVSFNVVPSLETPIQQDSLIETFDENLKERSLTATITPGIKDNGKEIQCTAQQFDNDPVPEVLFGTSSAQPVGMNVLYAPQPIGDAPFNAKLGEKVLVGIELLSNPMPDNFQWTMTTSSETSVDGIDASNTTATIDLVNGEKYVIEDLVDLGNQRYRADITINSVTEEDVKASYHLVLTNSVETVSYEFKLTMAGTIPPVVSNNLTMFVLIAVGCLIILVAILVAIYKKCSSSENETSPLIN